MLGGGRGGGGASGTGANRAGAIDRAPEAAAMEVAGSSRKKRGNRAVVQGWYWVLTGSVLVVGAGCVQWNRWRRSRAWGKDIDAREQCIGHVDSS